MTERIDRKIEISYYWNRNDHNDITPEHVEALEESALDRIFQQLNEGMREGELTDNIRMTDEDPEDGVSYSGWWKSKKTII